MTYFNQTYRELLSSSDTSAQYEAHFVNMHAVFLFFLTDVMLNVGQCVEYMLSAVIEFHAIGIVVLFINMFVIYVF